MTNRCYYLTKDHRLFIREKEMPVPAEGEVIIRPMANSICGSDIRMYTLAHMGKSYIREDRPISMGHECSGIITELGNGVTGLKIGQHVVIEPGIYCRRCHNCMTGRYNICDTFNFTTGTDPDDVECVEGHGTGSMRDYLAVPQHMIHVIPDSLPFDVAALAEPAAVAIHAVARAGNVIGKSAAVFGAGPIGIFVMQALMAAGAGTVTMIAPGQERLDMAMARGATDFINTSKTETLPTYAFDIAIETAGSPVATAQMIEVVKRGSTIVQVGWLSEDALMNIYEFNWKELNYYGAVDYAGEFPTAVQWLADGRIDGAAMITKRFAFEELSEAFRYTADNPKKCIKTVIMHDA